jgi:hypothetical protein
MAARTAECATPCERLALSWCHECSYPVPFVFGAGGFIYERVNGTFFADLA